MPDPLRLPPRDVSNAELYHLLDQVNTRLHVVSSTQSQQGKRMDKLETDISGLLAAWQAGGTLLSLAKIVTILGAAAGAVFAAFKLQG